MSVISSQARSARGYDRLARSYQLLERIAFGCDLQDARTAMIPYWPNWNRLLLIGDGDGRLLEAICQNFPTGHITSVDQSKEMLRMQRNRINAINASDRITWIHADILRGENLDWNTPDRPYDLVVTSFVLDCFTPEQLSMVIPKLAKLLNHDGAWSHCDFVWPIRTPCDGSPISNGLWRFRGWLLVLAMHWFFRWQTGLANRWLIDVNPWFQENDLVPVHEEGRSCGLIACELFQRSTTGSRSDRSPHA